MQPSYPPAPSTPQPSDYSFITNPAPPPKPGLSLPGNSSVVRLIIALAGLLVLIIIFAVIKSALSGSSNQPALLSVAQDQQEIIHLTTNVTQNSQGQLNVSTASQNFAATARLASTTAQQQLLAYMKTNHMKTSAKQLNLKQSAATDSQLSAAATSGTYDSTFKQIMQNELGVYKQDLSHAYDLTKGPKGRQLLNNDYNYAQLLLTQLNG
jgi:hypothetical protein